MIYEYPDPSQPIRQGDIFVGMPRIDISLRRVPVVGSDGQCTLVAWREILARREPVSPILSLRPVAAIVATQDCDSLHARDITLCEIRRFAEVEGKAAQTTSAKAWKNIITQHARINLKWFYLPPDDRVGFTQKMAVDFMVTLRLPRMELEELCDYRKGRLNNVADDHFRERIAEFFRRYPYNEWYPLDSAELQAYMNEYPDAEPYSWQAGGG